MCVNEGTAQRARVRPGSEQLPREFVAHHQRMRIMRAIAELVAERGYDAVRVADIVKRARIARNTFYDNFTGKEDCLLATYDHAVDEVEERMVGAVQAADAPWQVRVRLGLAVFLHYGTEEPAITRLCIVEAPSAGPEARTRHARTIEVFVPLVRLGRRAGTGTERTEQLPDTLEQAIVGGIFWIVHQRLVSGDAEDVEALLPELVEFAVRPYVGPADATAAAEAARGEARRGLYDRIREGLGDGGPRRLPSGSPPDRAGPTPRLARIGG